ncbi:hypothetical protein Tco_0162959 [Tanacetum coccineum]
MEERTASLKAAQVNVRTLTSSFGLLIGLPPSIASTLETYTQQSGLKASLQSITSKILLLLCAIQLSRFNRVLPSRTNGVSVYESSSQVMNSDSRGLLPKVQHQCRYSSRTARKLWEWLGIHGLPGTGRNEFNIVKAAERSWSVHEETGDYVMQGFGNKHDTDIQEKEQKESQNQQSQAREGKDQVKSKSKVIRLKKIQLEGLKLPSLKLYYKR